jgi:hypothetical protein
VKIKKIKHVPPREEEYPLSVDVTLMRNACVTKYGVEEG